MPGIKIKNIVLIVLTSSVIGILYNSINSAGIPFIKEERILVFESDSSLFIEDIEQIASDSTNQIDSQVNLESKNSAELNHNDEKNKDDDNPERETQKNITASPPKAIDINLAFKLFNQGVKFIDAREVADYESGHIKGAINVPFDGDESYRKVFDDFDKNETLVTYCAGTDCDLSILLGDELFEKGFKKVYVFFGGWNEWTEKNYPTNGMEQ